MAEPWFDPNQFGAWYGSIAGSLGGLMGGVVGVLAGTLVPRGKGRRFLLGLMVTFVVLGIAQFAFGMYALAMGQPYGIWYGPVLCGAVTTIVVGTLIPVIRARYREAEVRRVEAEGLRSSLI